MIKLNNSERVLILNANLEDDDNINFQDFENKKFFLKDYLFEMIFIIHPPLNFKFSNDESLTNNLALEIPNTNNQEIQQKMDELKAAKDTLRKNRIREIKENKIKIEAF